MKNSLPENESVPTENATQPNAHDSQQQPSKTSGLPVNDADNGKTQQPNTDARQQETEEEETDRKQDEAISSLAEQTDWIEQQTKWIKYQVVASAFLGVVTLGVLVYHGWIMSEQSDLMRKTWIEMRDTRELEIGLGSRSSKGMWCSLRPESRLSLTSSLPTAAAPPHSMQYTVAAKKNLIVLLRLTAL